MSSDWTPAQMNICGRFCSLYTLLALNGQWQTHANTVESEYTASFSSWCIDCSATQLARWLAAAFAGAIRNRLGTSLILFRHRKFYYEYIYTYICWHFDCMASGNARAAAVVKCSLRLILTPLLWLNALWEARAPAGPSRMTKPVPDHGTE